MGIRFYCPNGHKLHVKAFQAGMRGICPYCGAKVQIPLQSTRVSTKVLHAQRQQQSAQLAANSKPASATENGVAEEDRDTSVSATTLPPGAGPNIDGGNAATLATSGMETSPSQEFRSFPTPLTEEELGISLVIEDTATPRSAHATPPNPGGFDSLADSAADSEAGGNDAALTDPHLVWYVRPPSGGQFGPATAEILHQWLSEGRITPDTLVWHEGWRDWREARHVFSSFGGTEFPNPEGISPAADRILSRRTAPPTRRISMWIVLVVIVILIAAVGLTAFFFFRGSTSP